MIFGNEQARDLLHQFFCALQEKKTAFPFLLLTGRPHVGKTTCLEQEIRQFLGSYTSTDYVALYDLHEQLGKDHALKIEAGRDDEYITLGDTTYCQRGIREVTQRLALAPLGNWKVVFLENIERMTLPSANALLKTLEEPLPQRLIVATASTSEGLLDTIRSRALTIPFSLLDVSTMEQSLHTAYPTLSPEQKEFVCAFSFGAWGVVEQLLQSPELDQWVDQYSALARRFDTPTILQEQLVRLQRVAERGQLHQLIDALLYAGKGSPDTLVQVKKLLDTNVGQDNILFWWCLESVKKN